MEVLSIALRTRDFKDAPWREPHARRFARNQSGDQRVLFPLGIP